MLRLVDGLQIMKMPYKRTLFSNSVEKLQQTCPADAVGILEYLPRSFITFWMTASNQHYSRTVFIKEAREHENAL